MAKTIRRKLPEFYYIFGHTFEIIIRTKEEPGGLDWDNDDGNFSEDGEFIELRDDLNEEELTSAFYHELGHMMFWRAGVLQALEDGVAEIIVEQYGTLMRELFPEVIWVY